MYTKPAELPSFLENELLRLAQLERDIRASGTFAEPGRAIDTSGGYARARPPRVRGKAAGETIASGKVNGAEHRDWQQRIQRRNALQEIARRAIALQAMIANPIDWPETSGENSAETASSSNILKALSGIAGGVRDRSLT